MLSVLRHELLTVRQWLKAEEFADELTSATSIPGAIIVNFAIFHGYRLRGTTGSIAALFGTVLPSFLTILIVAAFLFPYFDNPLVASFLKGSAAAVAGLLGRTAFTMGKTMVKKPIHILLAATAALIALIPWIHPVFGLIIVGLVTFLISWRGKDNVGS